MNGGIVMKSIYLLKEDFKNFPIGEFPYDKNHSAMGEYHFVQYPGYYGKWYDPANCASECIRPIVSVIP